MYTLTGWEPKRKSRLLRATISGIERRIAWINARPRRQPTLSVPVTGTQIKTSCCQSVFEAGPLMLHEGLRGGTRLSGNPNLVFTNDGLGLTALHGAALTGRGGIAAGPQGPMSMLKDKDDQTPVHFAVRAAASAGNRDVAD